MPMESSLAGLALKTKENTVGFLEVDGARVLERFGHDKAKVTGVGKIIS